MAFSLEAALVIPLAISSWLGLLMAAGPAYGEVRQAARLEVLAASEGLADRHLYRTGLIEAGADWTPTIQTSPQAVIELASLIRDDWQAISRLFPEPAADLAPSGEASP